MFDIWLYSDETQTNEIRLSDPSGPATTTIASSVGASAGSSVVSSAGPSVVAAAGVATGGSIALASGLRQITLSSAGAAQGSSTARASSRARRRPTYGLRHPCAPTVHRDPNIQNFWRVRYGD